METGTSENSPGVRDKFLWGIMEVLDRNFPISQLPLQDILERLESEYEITFLEAKVKGLGDCVFIFDPDGVLVKCLRKSDPWKEAAVLGFLGKDSEWRRMFLLKSL